MDTRTARTCQTCGPFPTPSRKLSLTTSPPVVPSPLPPRGVHRTRPWGFPASSADNSPSCNPGHKFPKGRDRSGPPWVPAVLSRGPGVWPRLRLAWRWARGSTGSAHGGPTCRQPPLPHTGSAAPAASQNRAGLSAGGARERSARPQDRRPWLSPAGEGAVPGSQGHGPGLEAGEDRRALFLLP